MPFPFNIHSYLRGFHIGATMDPQRDMDSTFPRPAPARRGVSAPRHSKSSRSAFSEFKVTSPRAAVGGRNAVATAAAGGRAARGPAPKPKPEPQTRARARAGARPGADAPQFHDSPKPPRTHVTYARKQREGLAYFREDGNSRTLFSKTSKAPPARGTGKSAPGAPRRYRRRRVPSRRAGARHAMDSIR